MRELLSQWKWLGQYIRRYWLLVAVYTGLGVSGSLLGLGTSLVSRTLIDAVTGYNASNIASAASLYVGVGVGQILINVVKQRISLKIRLKITNEIKADIFTQILSVEWESIASYRSGDILYRMNGDTGMISNSILSFIPNVISVFISFGGAFLIMMQNDPVMALIALAGAPITLLSSRYMARRMREYQEKNQNLASTKMTVDQEIFQNLQIIKAFDLIPYFTGRFHRVQQESMEMSLDQNRASTKMTVDQEIFQNLQIIKAFDLIPYFTGRFHRVQQESMEMSLDQNRFQSGLTVVTSLVGQAVGYACYGFAIWRLWRGEISYGSMTMLVGMASSLRGSFSSVTGLLPTAIRAGISAGRVMELVDKPKEDRKGEEEAKKLKEEGGLYLEMKDGAFWYENGTPIYEGASFYGAPGEIIGLVGPSGEGKTTTFRLFLGLYALRKGSLRIGRVGGKSMEVSPSTRCLFRYIPQGNLLFQGTIADNLKMMKPDAKEEELIQALQMACAWEFVEKLEEGLNTQVRELGQRFSEGQKQRISIARAILTDAPILLLDEATSALDMETEQRVIENIVKHDPHRLIIVAAHRPSVFAVCNRIYRVEGGRMKEDGGTGNM